jgi:hypothetical protein
MQQEAVATLVMVPQPVSAAAPAAALVIALQKSNTGVTSLTQTASAAVHKKVLSLKQIAALLQETCWLSTQTVTKPTLIRC